VARRAARGHGSFERQHGMVLRCEIWNTHIYILYIYIALIYYIILHKTILHIVRTLNCRVSSGVIVVLVAMMVYLFQTL
jgi:hypothetical protein